jgi:hypothetical protein
MGGRVLFVVRASAPLFLTVKASSVRMCVCVCWAERGLDMPPPSGWVAGFVVTLLRRGRRTVASAWAAANFHQSPAACVHVCMLEAQAVGDRQHPA